MIDVRWRTSIYHEQAAANAVELGSGFRPLDSTSAKDDAKKPLAPRPDARFPAFPIAGDHEHAYAGFDEKRAVHLGGAQAGSDVNAALAQFAAVSEQPAASWRGDVSEDESR
jgi:hypothetical protein